jgi:serine/threonine protein kinase
VQAGVILLDRYELVEPIGEGATSTVWDAIDRQGGERVAVKGISLDEAGWRAEVRDRFQQEARLLALVRHEHLVGVRNVGETDDGYLFIILDKLTGETLADRIGRPPPLGWREASRIALQIARGLSALHARGIVHRDVKPANVILHQDQAGVPSEEPVAKIIDLGVSKVRAAAADPVLYATLTATGQVLGTAEYMSYEQALGERDIDFRSDVWAVGVVLYEMLGGRRPFEAPNVNAVLAAIRRGAPPSLKDLAPHVHPSLVAVVTRCLEQAKDARFRDGEELALAIEAAIIEGEREQATRPRWGRRTLGIGIALAAAGAVGLFLLSAPSEPLGGSGVAGSLPAGSAAAPSVKILPASSTPETGPPPRAEEDRRSAVPADAKPAASFSLPPGVRKGSSPSRPPTRVDNVGF